MLGSMSGGGTTASGAGGGRCSGCLTIPGSVCDGGAGGTKAGFCEGGEDSAGGKAGPGSAVAALAAGRYRSNATIRNCVGIVFMAEPPHGLSGSLCGDWFSHPDSRDVHERDLRRPRDEVRRAAAGLDPSITFATVCSTVPITLPRIFPTARPTFWACPREVEARFVSARVFLALCFFSSVATPEARRGFRSMTWVEGSISRCLARRIFELLFLRTCVFFSTILFMFPPYDLVPILYSG